MSALMIVGIWVLIGIVFVGLYVISDEPKDDI